MIVAIRFSGFRNDFRRMGRVKTCLTTQRKEDTLKNELGLSTKA